MIINLLEDEEPIQMMMEVGDDGYLWGDAETDWANMRGGEQEYYSGHVYIVTHMNICICTHTCVYMYIDVYAYVCICVCVPTYTLVVKIRKEWNSSNILTHFVLLWKSGLDERHKQNSPCEDLPCLFAEYLQQIFIPSVTHII